MLEMRLAATIQALRTTAQDSLIWHVPMRAHMVRRLFIFVPVKGRSAVGVPF